MTTNYPAGLTRDEVARVHEPPPRSAPAALVNAGSWRYDRARPARGMIALAALLSAGLHAAVLFGFGHAKKKPTAAKPVETIAVMLTMPKIEELEEPEPLPTDETSRSTDMATLVPMQADLPQISRPSDFVQTINFTSLIDKPDFSNIAISVIPDEYRGGRKLAESIGKIFNLADLDRVPDPTVQQAPMYPFALKRDGVTGMVRVQFVVDVDGRVLDAHAVESTHPGFEDAAVSAVSKWRFRPGIKGGRKVNTRMAVPIVFELNEKTD